MKKSILLTSAGIDSLSTLILLNKQGISYLPVYIDYDGKYCKYEKKVIQRRYSNNMYLYRPNIHKIDIKSFVTEKDNSTSEFMLRNYIFILLALSKYVNEDTNEIELILSYSKDDFAPDTVTNMIDSSFDECLSRALYYFTNRKVKINIISILQELTKPQTWDIIKNNVTAEMFLNMSFSCYSPLPTTRKNIKINEIMCKSCKACFRYSVALNYMYSIIIPHLNESNFVLNRKYSKDYIDAVKKYKKSLSNFYIYP